MSVAGHPRRRLRSELGSLASVLAIPVGLLMVFPYEAIGFVPSASPKSRAQCAFVSLTAEQERKMLAVARSAWQVGAEGVRGLRTEMAAGELPAAPMGAVLGVRSVRSDSGHLRTDFTPDSLPPSRGAAPPSAIVGDPEPTEPHPAFSRDELLKID
jgi:hypothetical protein